jgi:FAD/FMN-containing dehydrogenase
VTACTTALAHSKPHGCGALPREAVDRYTSWGRFPKLTHDSVYRVYWRDEVQPLLASLPAQGALPYGFGRSYGDSCLSEGRSLIDCSQLARFLDFDPATGRLVCEAGVSLADVLQFALPQGWFLPVTPGTKFVSIGGAIANDVHGKNHHRSGCFGNHVTRIELARSDAGIVQCTPSFNEDMFRATIGGLGLTGVILSAELQLKRVPGNRMAVEAIPFHSLSDFLALSAQSDRDFEYTVAWIDCLARHTRGIFLRGNHRPGFEQDVRRKSGPGVPFAMPDAFLNRTSIKAFNMAYFYSKKWCHSASKSSIESFFYPLDSIQNWNLIYGKNGFVQYQCVLPDDATQGMEDILRLISDAGRGSFLAVLKKFGHLRSPGMMSFPRPGLTLALDFAMRSDTLPLLQRLDEMVATYDGALYPAKDGRITPAIFEQSFPQWREFSQYIDPKLSSSFWRRVTGGQA